MAYHGEVCRTRPSARSSTDKALGPGAPEAHVRQPSLWETVALGKHPAKQHCTPQHGHSPIIYHVNLQEQRREAQDGRSHQYLVKAGRKVWVGGRLWEAMEKKSDEELVFLALHHHHQPGPCKREGLKVIKIC